MKVINENNMRHTVSPKSLITLTNLVLLLVI